MVLVTHDAVANIYAIPLDYTTFRYECHSSSAGRRRTIWLIAEATLLLVPGAMIIQFLPAEATCSATSRPSSVSMIATALCSMKVRVGRPVCTPDWIATIDACADRPFFVMIAEAQGRPVN